VPAATASAHAAANADARAQQQTNCTVHVAGAVDRRDRQTDGRTDNRQLHGPSIAYYAGSLSNYNGSVTLRSHLRTDGFRKASHFVWGSGGQLRQM